MVASLPSGPNEVALTASNDVIMDQVVMIREEDSKSCLCDRPCMHMAREKIAGRAGIRAQAHSAPAWHWFPCSHLLGW